jgi:hypothetical protein
MTISSSEMKSRLIYAKHFTKKVLCDAYLFALKFDKSKMAQDDSKEIESYRRNHVQKLSELRK